MIIQAHLNEVEEGCNACLSKHSGGRGQRIAKHIQQLYDFAKRNPTNANPDRSIGIYSSSGDWEKSTYYIRDAQGNVMSTYEHKVESSMLSYKLNEQHIYGSSRLGMRTDTLELIAATLDTTNHERILRKKNYELSNHLGNVLTVITDMKIPIESTLTAGTVGYFQADILSATDYSPFGVILEDRDFSSEKYSMGFNGMRKDDEVKGSGNSYDYKERFYDNRLSRFLSMDKLVKSFPWYSPYQFAGNKPTIAIDRDGMEEFIMIEKGDIYIIVWDIKARTREGESGTIQYITEDGVKSKIRPLNEKESKVPYISDRVKLSVDLTKAKFDGNREVIDGKVYYNPNRSNESQGYASTFVKMPDGQTGLGDGRVDKKLVEEEKKPKEIPKPILFQGVVIKPGEKGDIVLPHYADGTQFVSGGSLDAEHLIKNLVEAIKSNKSIKSVEINMRSFITEWSQTALDIRINYNNLAKELVKKLRDYGVSKDVDIKANFTFELGDPTQGSTTIEIK